MKTSKSFDLKNDIKKEESNSNLGLIEKNLTIHGEEIKKNRMMQEIQISSICKTDLESTCTDFSSKRAMSEGDEHAVIIENSFKSNETCKNEISNVVKNENEPIIFSTNSLKSFIG